MSEPAPGHPVDHEVLADMLARSVSALPGVVRLEPTVKSTLTRVRAVSRKSIERLTAPGAETAATGRDGIHLRIENGTVQLRLEIATDAAHSCLETANTAQQTAAETIEQAGLRAASVDVAILSIENSPRGTGTNRHP